MFFCSRCDEEILEMYPMTLPKGHPMLDEFSYQVKDSFNKRSHASIGAELIKEKLKKRCK